MQNLRLHNENIHRNIYQNRFINECARKNSVKIPEHGVSFVRYVEELKFLLKYYVAP
jgi:hypothetical protein